MELGTYSWGPYDWSFSGTVTWGLLRSHYGARDYGHPLPPISVFGLVFRASLRDYKVPARPVFAPSSSFARLVHLPRLFFLSSHPPGYYVYVCVVLMQPRAKSVLHPGPLCMLLRNCICALTPKASASVRVGFPPPDTRVLWYLRVHRLYPRQKGQDTPSHGLFRPANARGRPRQQGRQDFSTTLSIGGVVVFEVSLEVSLGL